MVGSGLKLYSKIEIDLKIDIDHYSHLNRVEMRFFLWSPYMAPRSHIDHMSGNNAAGDSLTVHMAMLLIINYSC